MASIALFLRPDRIGISRMKSPGSRPQLSKPVWKIMDEAEMAGIMNEPLLLAAAVRELIGDGARYDIYMAVWPDAYNAVMFSYGNKNRGDISRLRQSELETVFRGGQAGLYTYDLILNGGKPHPDGRRRRIIYVMQKDRINLLRDAFAAQQMKLCRIAPVEAAAADAVLHSWASEKSAISVGILLEGDCICITFVKGGYIQAIRTLPTGFSSVAKYYAELSGLTAEDGISYILTDGTKEVKDSGTPEHIIQDELMRLISRISTETVRTLHTVFGDDATLGRALLFGQYACVPGLADKINELLQLNAETVKDISASAVSAAVLDEGDLSGLFHLAPICGKGADMLLEQKKARDDRILSGAICGVLLLALVGLLCYTPAQKVSLQAARDNAAAILQQPDYVAVQELFARRAALRQEQEDLEAAIAALPHGASNTAGIIGDLLELTGRYGDMVSIAVDRNAGRITLDFTTLNYDSFDAWQRKITEDDRFSFVVLPSINGNGLIFNVDAVLTATDFEGLVSPMDTEDAAGQEQEGI